MSLTSFYTALTGLNNNSASINVIGDNLANMNTVGFKASKVNFGEMLSGLQGTSTNDNPISFGLGSTITGITRMDNQGTVTFTGRSTDAAINGNGFFVVNTEGGMGFTRSGNFEYNREGGLMTSDGFELLGYMAVNGELDTSSALVPIEIQKGQLVPGRATETLSVTANLDSRLEIGESFATPAQIYDSLGSAHNVTLNYTKTGISTWDWEATIPAVDTGGVEADPPVSIGSGSLTFNNLGELTDPTANPALNVTGLVSGGADIAMTLRLFDDNDNGLLSNFASESAVSTTNQNGSPASVLKDIRIDSSGVIVGETETAGNIILAQLALADFPNVQGLQKYKGSTFVPFPSSGEPSIGTAGTGGRGTITGSALEQSNVDMALEFVNLIQAQRAYQANSRIISTTDELYQESINLKR